MSAPCRARRTWMMVAPLLLSMLLGPVRAEALPDRQTHLATPELIRWAERRGDIDAMEALRLRTLAFAAPDLLPEPFRSNARWDGTLEALALRSDLDRLPRHERALVAGMAGDPLAHLSPSVGHFCFLSASPMPSRVMTEHFFVEYDPVRLAKSGIAVDAYLDALEEAWAVSVTSFGWAPPPPYVAGGDPDAPWAEPAPGNRYHVRIDALPPGLHGQVSVQGRHAGFVGDNPATPWDDRDAHASCMMLSADFASLSDQPLAALRATVAHELHHALQIGIGAIFELDPDGDMIELDPAIAEATATAMEDEVFDDADDNHHVLWPDFEDDLGDHAGDPYKYWLTWRGLTERFGSTVPGGAEQLYQDLYERLSQEWAMLDVAEAVFAARGVPFGTAFHEYAIAVRFPRDCGSGDGWHLCLEEGLDYVAAAPEPMPYAGELVLDVPFTGSVPDNYAIDHLRLPKGRLRVSAANTDQGGALRISIGCGGADLRVVPMPSVLEPGDAREVTIDTTDCVDAFAVVTNEGRTGGPNPDTTTMRSYEMTARPL